MEQVELKIETQFMVDAKKHSDCSHELKKGEVWIGNTKGTEIPGHYKSLKTIRIGEQAYDINGKPLDRGCYRPLILHLSEEPMYNLIYDMRMKKSRRW